MKAEDNIVAAIEAAKDRGVQIIRGPVFDWVHPDRIPRELPYACNTIGAILLLLGKEQMVGPKPPYFIPGYHKLIEEYLGVNDFWLWRFGAGFNGGYQITLTVVDKDGKEKVRKDDVSALGIAIRKRFGVG